MVPTGKSSDVLHLQITFCKSELECSTLLLIYKGAVIKNVTDWGGRDFVGV